LALTIRLSRTGRKKVPHYRIAVNDQHARRDGQPIEVLGTYHPNEEPALRNLKENAFYEWLKKGAILSDTIRSLLMQQGIWAKWRLLQAGKDISTIPAQPKPKKIKPPQPSKKTIAKQKAEKEALQKKETAETKPAG
jgi:small subunit ribosomal protein S16